MMSSQNDAAASCQSIDGVEDLAPTVLGHEDNQCIHSDNSLLAEVIENYSFERLRLSLE
jgi:hypothetical protein